MADPEVNPQRHDPHGSSELRVKWDGLALPAAQREQLREIALQARQRETTRSAREPGIGVVFVGRPGAGMTTAAEALARELQRDLHRIDLSRVVSRYIGETEKNLARLFDAAEERGAILLLDEADALFGKRTEVKDGHDRYADSEVGYLLQRVESRRGLTILTTSTKENIDEAFLRRLRFVVSFPSPDEPDMPDEPGR